MRTSLIAVALLALAGSACSSADSTGVPPVPLAASYRAALPTAGTRVGSLIFTTTQNGVTTDRDATGADVRVVLAADGTTSGRLYIPDAPADNGGTAPFDADLAGTWSVSAGVVTLRHAADTFLRDMPLSTQGDRLVGDRTFGTVRVRLTLVRQ